MSDSSKAPTELQLARKRELLARLLKERTASHSPSGGPPIGRVARDRPLAVSFAQQRLWILDQLEPGRATYNVSGCVRLQGALDKGALTRTLAALVARHETLRTVFHEDDRGHPLQVIQPASEWRLEEEDLIEAPEVTGDGSIRRSCAAWAQEPFDLKRGPLFRARLWTVTAEVHVLGLTMHHIVADEWSLGVLLRELVSGYEAEQQGIPATWPPLQVQYADYAAWQREWLRGDVLEGQLEYWRRQLTGVPFLELPTDRPRPTEPTQQGAHASRILPTALGEGLRALGRREGTTLFMTLLAGLQVLLHRYTAQDDIAVGSPIANRTRPEVEGLIGFFVNTLVLRTDLSGDPTGRELLQRVKEVCLGAYTHQDAPFEKLVEELTPTRETNRTPLFEVMLVVPDAARMDIRLPGLTMTSLELSSRTAKFDLTFFVVQAGPELVTLVEYSTDLFDAATIERLLDHWSRVLEGLVANPDARLSALPLLTATERRQVLVEWNRTAAEYRRDGCVHDLISAQAARTPEAVALVCGDQALTYGELDRRANQVAWHLRARGVAPEVLVGLCVERSIEMVVGLLGILKVGGAYVPLDPAHPVERLRFVLEDTRAPVVVTQEAVRATLPLASSEALSLDGDSRAIAAEPAEAPVTGVQPDNLAYVIYTSGSTGKPKGVAISHRSVVNFLTSMRKEPGLAADDILLAVTTLSFDIAGLELLLPLTVGARVTIASREIAMDGAALAALLADAGATVMQATPATWRMLIESGWRGTPGFKVLCGGEAMTRDLAAGLLERAGEVWNLYGPTETTIWSTVDRVMQGEGPVPIGRPVANTQTYVLDAQGQPVPIGVAGELCIGGDGVARGYWNRSELTQERFVPDRFRDVPGARFYRTGDLARYRPDGVLECLGRVDQQVKVRGFRIEPGEVEAELTRHSGVRQAVVVAREDRPGDRRLVAYVVPSEGHVPAGDELRAALRRTLPEYMVPTAYVMLPALPLTGNGKVDRRALPAPGREERGEGRGYLAPRSETERTIAAIWQELLGVQAVGIYDNFFDLGGHSLLAIQAVHETKKRLGRGLTVRDLLRQNVAQVAAGVDETASDDARSRIGPAAPQALGGELAESPTLTAFYFGGPSRELFAVHHRPRRRAAPAGGVVCCYPVGQEYVRSHRAFEQLCDRLSRTGLDALRFDYHGTGDSAGNSDDGGIPEWTDDIERALAHARSTVAGPLSLVGLRLGASLAALAGSRRGDVESLVLWHPVVDGRAYLEDVRAAHRALVADRELQRAPGPDEDELLGFPMPPAMRTTIEAINLLELERRPARRILLIGFEASGPDHDLKARLERLGADVDAVALADPQIWRELGNMYQPLVPRRTLERIAAWLDGDRP